MSCGPGFAGTPRPTTRPGDRGGTGSGSSTLRRKVTLWDASISDPTSNIRLFPPRPE